MKILLINRWVGYNEGGNETQMKDLITQFIKLGHKITVITTHGTALDVFKGSIDVVYVNSPQKYFSYGLSGIYYALLFNLKSFFAFLKLYVAGERFDVMSIHFSLEAQLARVIKIIFGIPYVIFLAGDTPLELIEAKRADGKVQISHFMNEQCLKYGYSAEVISKGLDLGRYNPQIDSSSLRDKLNIGNKTAILSMCRLDPRKSLITLIEAAAILKSQNYLEDKVFIIAGDGVEKEYLQNQVMEKGLDSYFKFVGSIPNTSAEHPMYYTMSKLFVLPTLYEGFGWVFLEAMASGVPIVTTDAGSNPEVVGGIGELVPVKSPDKLAAAIKMVLDDSSIYNKFRELGLQKAQGYSWDIVSKKFDKYYQDISKLKCYSLKCKLDQVYFIFADMFFIVNSLFKDKVILNKEKQKYSAVGQKGGSGGSL